MKKRNPDNTWQVRASRVLAQGHTGTNSKRPTAFIEGIYPTHVVKGIGCNLYDAWGNKYIDYVGGLGSQILGYGHKKVAEAVQNQLETGIITASLPTTLEVEVAETIQRMFHVKRLRFLKNGDDATTAAIRIARGYLGDRENVFSQGYHGRSDIWTSMTPPSIGVYSCPGELGISNEFFGQPIAIVEPIHLDPEADKAKTMELFSNHKIVIFDEIITGLRVPKNSVSSWWHVPDMACFGKAFANGFPISIVGGSEEIMDGSEYFISSTFSGEAASLAACKATLEEIERLNKTEDLWYYANRFQTNLNKVLKPIDVEFKGYGTRAMLDTTKLNSALLMQEACKSGIIFGAAFFYNYAHLEANVDDLVLNIVSDIVTNIQSGRVKLEGKMPQSAIRKVTE